MSEQNSPIEPRPETPISSSVTAPAYLDDAAVRAAISPGAAVAAVQDALKAGFEPGTDHARVFEKLTRGDFLLMPSEVGPYAGIKVLTAAPDNPGVGLPRIQGLYILFDSETLTPRLLLDGAALTSIRTPAVSLAATAGALLRSSEPLDVVIFGAGPQAVDHLATLRAVLGDRRPLASVTVVVRTLRSVELPDVRVVQTGSAEAEAAVAAAGVIMCATTARTPLFDSAAVRSDAVIIAVGSHEPDARELDSALMGRSQVVVEDVPTALRESGDVIMAIAEGALTANELIPLADVIRGGMVLDGARPVLFKSSGMSWEDLAIAAAIAHSTAHSTEHRIAAPQSP
ncbi:ornithine cyclodeaminase family protein [Salinibacterium sp. SWN139]|uniref:ornithine cyclodeaminase family protein n=1 Tax=Salinibacterium sp. SWN139 TaxID=2792055 RepID=UPI0018CD2CF1|nr:ornithine cyclodeaminase family protein [Salinibacterium sp. SWN139]MBH0055089.1 ornithine cyclodeaminase family protein [Salinibacterium sp. SWN139]